MDHVTRLIHEGKGFHVDGQITILAAASYTFVGVIGAVEAHFHDFGVSASGGPVLIELIESPTVSNYGTPAVAHNRRRGTGNQSLLKPYAGATISGGTVIATSIGYVGGVGSNVDPGSALLRGEWVLEPNTIYAIRVTNNDNATITSSIDMDFYEMDL